MLEVDSELSSYLIIASCSHGEKHCGVVGDFRLLDDDDDGDKRICSRFTITFVSVDDDDDEVEGCIFGAGFIATKLSLFNLCIGLSLPTISILF